MVPGAGIEGSDSKRGTGEVKGDGNVLYMDYRCISVSKLITCYTTHVDKPQKLIL